MTSTRLRPPAHPPLPALSQLGVMLLCAWRVYNKCSPPTSPNTPPMLLMLHHLTQLVSQVVTACSKTAGPSKAVLHAWWQALAGTTSKSPELGFLSPGVRFLVMPLTHGHADQFTPQQPSLTPKCCVLFAAMTCEGTMAGVFDCFYSMSSSGFRANQQASIQAYKKARHGWCTWLSRYDPCNLAGAHCMLIAVTCSWSDPE